MIRWGIKILAKTGERFCFLFYICLIDIIKHFFSDETSEKYQQERNTEIIEEKIKETVIVVTYAWNCHVSIIKKDVVLIIVHLPFNYLSHT